MSDQTQIVSFLKQILDQIPSIKAEIEAILARRQEELEGTEKRLCSIWESSSRNLSLDVISTKFEEITCVRGKIVDVSSLQKEFQRFSIQIANLISSIIDSTIQKVELPKYKLSLIENVMDRELIRVKESLPFLSFRHQLLTTIQNSSVTIVIGETGSGKSTQMAQYLLDELVPEKQVVVTQPRKVAAKSIASRLATGYKYGNLVTSNNFAPGSRIVFMTDSKLLYEKKLTQKYSYVIIDEAHERSVDTDLLIANCKRALSKGLKLVITSATLNAELFQNYFGGARNCPIVRVPGRTFPVEIEWNDSEPDNYISQSIQKAISIHKSRVPGDILVFLTGQQEVEEFSF